MTINWQAFNPEMSFLGGMLIGIAALILMLTKGRVLGVSGILSGLISPASAFEFTWRLAFVAGTILAPILFYILTGTMIEFTAVAKSWQLYGAALLVGIGTVFGSGCTSGHGICGISRLSVRSIIKASVLARKFIAAIAVGPA